MQKIGLLAKEKCLAQLEYHKEHYQHRRNCSEMVICTAFQPKKAAVQEKMIT
jgi:hypothetical protein